MPGWPSPEEPNVANLRALGTVRTSPGGLVMSSKPKLVVKLPKALQEDSRAPKPQTVKPQKKRKQPEGEDGSHLSAGSLAAAKKQLQGPAPTAKKKFKVFGPGSHKPASSAFTPHGGPGLIKPRISVK